MGKEKKFTPSALLPKDIMAKFICFLGAGIQDGAPTNFHLSFAAANTSYASPPVLHLLHLLVPAQMQVLQLLELLCRCHCHYLHTSKCSCRVASLALSRFCAGISIGTSKAETCLQKLRKFSTINLPSVRTEPGAGEISSRSILCPCEVSILCTKDQH